MTLGATTPVDSGSNRNCTAGGVICIPPSSTRPSTQRETWPGRCCGAAGADPVAAVNPIAGTADVPRRVTTTRTWRMRTAASLSRRPVARSCRVDVYGGRVCRGAHDRNSSTVGGSRGRARAHRSRTWGGRIHPAGPLLCCPGCRRFPACRRDRSRKMVIPRAGKGVGWWELLGGMAQRSWKRAVCSSGYGTHS